MPCHRSNVQFDVENCEFAENFVAPCRTSGNIRNLPAAYAPSFFHAISHLWLLHTHSTAHTHTLSRLLAHFMVYRHLWHSFMQYYAAYAHSLPTHYVLNLYYILH